MTNGNSSGRSMTELAHRVRGRGTFGCDADNEWFDNEENIDFEGGCFDGRK